MATRKERKEALRRERLERERQAKEAERRRRLLGYGAGGALAAAVVVVLVVVLAGGGGEADEAGDQGFPSGGEVPSQRASDLRAAARAAGCELDSFRAKSRDHTRNPGERVAYPSNPPAAGRHYEIPAEDGAYAQAPDVTTLVHSLEHGRVVIWFRPNAPERVKADLKALFDEDTYQMILTPNTTNMPYEVAASAWSRDPAPLGTGRLLSCRRFNDRVFDAIRTFKDEHRGNGPEAVP